MPAQPPLRKAIIPVAGKGTRMRPITYAFPKALLPLVDGEDRLRPVLHWILAECAAARLDTAVLIISPDQEEPLTRYLRGARSDGLEGLPETIEFVVQHDAHGFGHAVLLARPAIQNEPFLLFLGDHVWIPDPAAPPVGEQVAAAFRRSPCRALVAMQPVDIDELPRVGVARGEPLGEPGMYRCTDFVEKPDLATARHRLVTPGLAPDTFLAHAGIYAFDPVLFDLLDELAARPRTGKQEVQLADAQSMLLARYPDAYTLYRIRGKALDTGTPGGYARTQAEWARGDRKALGTRE